MPSKRSRKQMTSAEQARYSESRYANDAYSDYSANGRSSSRNTRRAASSGQTYDAPSRIEGVRAYTSRRQQKDHKNVLVGVLVTLCVVLACVGVAIAWYIIDINSRLSEGVDGDLLAILVDTSEKDDPFYMLLLGIDKSDERTGEWGSDPSNFRADTIILTRVDPKSQSVTLVSIPRDTMVTMGEHGTQKINAAYSFGGASYMVEVVSELTGVDISHYAEIDFEQFTSIVDTIGGVEVTLEIDVVDEQYAGINLSAGTYTLDGTMALALVRTRHAYDSYGAGDYYRQATQRMVIAAIMKKVLSLDLTTMASAISTMAGSVTTDLDVTKILSLANQFRSLDVDNNVYSGMCPTTSAYIDNLWYEIVDETAWTKMMERVKAGQAPYESEEDNPTAGVVGTTGGYGTDDISTLEADYSGLVLVLNGTGVSGVASDAASTLRSSGFTSSADNASSSSIAETAIFYNGSSSIARAKGVALSLGLSENIILENTGEYPTTYDVVALLGVDYLSEE